MTPAALLQAAERRRTAETDYRSAVLYHVIPRESAQTALDWQGLRYGSDGVVYLWPTLALAESWQEETGGVILWVDPPGPLEVDPYASAARCYRGDIPADRLGYA